MGKTILIRPLLFVIGLAISEATFAASCDYKILSEWNTGFTGEVTILNDSSETIDEWTVSWTYSDDSTIPQVWNAELTSTDPFTATNVAHNGTIPANSSTNFGFNGNKASPGVGAEIPELGGICSQGTPVNQPPVADISADPTQGNIPLNVTFSASGSSDPENSALSYRWDFGDGDISTEAVATHTFDQEGSYSVSLTVNDGELDSTEVFTTIVATDEPVGEPDSYVLDPENSSLYFVSTKQTHVVETHQFTNLYGGISSGGEASLVINLGSVETGIDIRNQRMRDLLFEVEIFSEAVITLPVNLASLDTQAVGSTLAESISATMDLHGVSAAVDTEVAITKISDSQIMVQNVSPILIQAADYDLTGGIDALRTIANLAIISYAVPVNFTLLFNTQEAQ